MNPRPGRAQRVLVVRPRPATGGGVAYFYDALQPHLGTRVEQFRIGEEGRHESSLVKTRRVLSELARFVRACARPDVRVVHVNPSLDLKSLLRDGAYLLIARLLRKATLIFFRGWEEASARLIERRFLWLFRPVFLRSQAICVLSTAFGETIRRWGYAGPLRVWTTTVDDSVAHFAEAHPRLVRREEADRPLTLAFMARVAKAKGIFETIEAVALADELGHGFRLLVIGDGPELSPAKRSVQREGHRGIVFTGHLDNEAKAGALAQADIFVLATSESEGMPNALLEAMAMGLPCVVTPVGGIADIVKIAGIGAVLDSIRPSEIAAAIIALACDPEGRERLGRSNAELARRAFGARVAAERLGVLYDGVIDEGTPVEPYVAWYDSWSSPIAQEVSTVD